MTDDSTNGLKMYFSKPLSTHTKRRIEVTLLLQGGHLGFLSAHHKMEV